MTAFQTKKRSRKSISEKTLRRRVGMGVAVFGIICLVTVWLRVTAEGRLRKIGELEAQLKEIEAHNAELQVTLVQLEDMQRVLKELNAKDDFIFPEKIYLDVPKKYTKLVKIDE